jgi:hypothetical protein
MPLLIPGKRISMRPTARMILDSFDTIIIVMLPNRTRELADIRLFRDKAFRTWTYLHLSTSAVRANTTVRRFETLMSGCAEDRT